MVAIAGRSVTAVIDDRPGPGDATTGQPIVAIEIFDARFEALP
jgi:hypothetical protein